MSKFIIHNLYNLIITIYYLIIRLVAPFNSKAKLWINIRRNWKQHLNSTAINSPIWIHVASVGELEIAKAYIHSTKRKLPTPSYIISYFSPSVLEFPILDTTIDILFPLPYDYSCNIEYICCLYKPKQLVLIRNERWLNLVTTCAKNKIPIRIIEAERQATFYSSYIDQFINDISYADEYSYKLEQVLSNTIAIYNDVIIDSFAQNSICILLGSCYTEEVEAIAPLLNKYKQLKLLLFPHEFDENTPFIYQSILNKSLSKYSDGISNASILLVDQKGILKYCYKFATIAIIGGGFNYQLHNIFEAGCFGIPVFCGNKIQHDSLLKSAIQQGLIHTFTSSEELAIKFDKFITQPNLLENEKEKWTLFFNNKNLNANL